MSADHHDDHHVHDRDGQEPPTGRQPEEPRHASAKQGSGHGPDVADTLEILRFEGALLRDGEGRIWLALRDTTQHGGGRMPHLVAADTVRVTGADRDGLDLVKDPAPGSGEFASALRAFRLKGDLRDDVERLLEG